MSVSEQLKILAVKLNISLSEMARRCGKSPQAFIQKVNRGKFTPEDLENIAEKLGCKYEQYFITDKGDKI